jgi:transcriptional regulator with AAA-type ATPase domain
MALFLKKELPLAQAIRALVFTNPFTPARRELEKIVLDAAGVHREGPHWMERGTAPSANRQMVETLAGCAERLAERALTKLHQGKRPRDDAERDIYINCAFVAVYFSTAETFDQIIARSHEKGSAPERFAFYPDFKNRLNRYFNGPDFAIPLPFTYPTIFALCFQLRRAFYHIFASIIGTSARVTQLRRRVWESIFTHDMERYLKGLHLRMGDIVTLITGPSGSGKELVARGIGLSRFIPFEESSQNFADDFIRGFFPINLSALSSTLIESELFGHQKGAFTGALADRLGYLEVCGPFGTVFLDEIGETDPTIQVKLLRVLQTRQFQKLGDTRLNTFEGKVMAATNRDLSKEIREGKFREDFYYRLCADTIETPSLRELLQDGFAELGYLVGHIAKKAAGEDLADSLTSEVMDFVTAHLGIDYSWPGNFRELEQCVRNVLVSKAYRPLQATLPHETAEQPSPSGLPLVWNFLEKAQWTHKELMAWYCHLALKTHGSPSAAAKALQIDPRTLMRYASGYRD